MAHTVDVPEITTVMVTSAYIDMLVDLELFKLQNRPRDRRYFFAICFWEASLAQAHIDI